MQRARRKQLNPINAPALVRWIVITAFLAGTGLIYVYRSVQLYHLGDQKKALENELIKIHSESDYANVRIAELTSRPVLQRRLRDGSLKMSPIAEQFIVHLSGLPRSRGEDVVQPVVNQRPGQ